MEAIVPIRHLVSWQLEGNLGHLALDGLFFQCDGEARFQGYCDVFGAPAVEVANLGEGCGEPESQMLAR